jgi:hypothetical protein
MIRILPACLAVCIALAACAGGKPHSAEDYRRAVAVGDPDGHLTTITGPDTVVLDVTAPMKFPQGDGAMVHSTLSYDGPSSSDGTCVFHITYETQYEKVEGPQLVLPCDGKRWARLHVNGVDGGFIAHLHHMNYKGTPVTLLEISSQDVPESIRLTY